MNENTHFIELKNGITLPYVEQGDPSGTPIIFLHGVTDSHRSFDLLREHIPDEFRAIAVTQRGHGDASKPASGYSSADLAEDLKLFMRALRIESAFIVGHSMGSFVAQRFAAENPEMVRGLVVIGSFPTCADNESVKQFVDAVVRPLTDPIPREVAADFQAGTYSKSLPSWFEELVVNESLKAPARVWKEACLSMIEADHSTLLKNIKAKTLLLWGSEDAFFSVDDQERLLSLIPDAWLNIYDGIGHTPQWEDPKRTAADILTLVAQITAAAAQRAPI